MVPYSQLFTEIPKLVAVELSSIVGIDDSRNSKSTNKVLANKLLYLGLRYNYQRFCFHPLCEIINNND